MNPEQIVMSRYNICSKCLNFNRIMSTCSANEKIIPIFIKYINRSCPVGKW